MYALYAVGPAANKEMAEGSNWKKFRKEAGNNNSGKDSSSRSFPSFIVYARVRKLVHALKQEYSVLNNLLRLTIKVYK